jgi:hypothetical protein
MGLFDLLGNGGMDPYADRDAAQGAADHIAQAGGWHEPPRPSWGGTSTPTRTTTSPTAPAGSTSRGQAGRERRNRSRPWHLREDP